MKRTKKQLAERKTKAAEIAALYNTVSGGGRMQFRCSKKGWIEDPVGPDLMCDLSIFRVIPAPKKKATPAPKKPEPKTWWIRLQNGRVISVQEFEPPTVSSDGEYIKVQEVQP